MSDLKPQLLLSLRNYSKEAFVKDLVAGVIVAIIALPLSIALALASGVSPEQGLYTAIVAGFLISALGGSKVQIAGPTAGLCHHRGGHRGPQRHGRPGGGHHSGGHSAHHHGPAAHGQHDQVHPLYHYHRLHRRASP